MNTNRLFSRFAICAFLCVAGALLAACGGSGSNGGSTSNTTTAGARLTNDQEMFDPVPPTTSGAVGTGSVTVDQDSGAINGSVVFDSGYAPTMVHIHQAAAGSTGAIIVTLVQDASNPAKWNIPDGTTLSAAQLVAFNLGNLYFNAHTSANPNGEIRGQIGREVYTAVMTNAQEQLADATTGTITATGIGLVVLNPATSKASAAFQATGLSGSATAGHIHIGGVGVSGMVTITMTEDPPGSGAFAATATLTADQLTALRSGNLYFNVHTTLNPNGEIRGQIGRAVRIAEPLSGAMQVPSVTSAGSGSGFATLDPATRTLSGSMTINDITPTAAHIHSAAVGANGPVIVPLTLAGSASPFSASGSGKIGTADAKAFLDGNTYLNVHTAAHPNGEIRGQLNIP